MMNKGEKKMKNNKRTKLKVKGPEAIEALCAIVIVCVLGDGQSYGGGAV
jgi:hypothetical protein